MEKIAQNFNKINIPNASDDVYKDECMYCFDSPDSSTGLYVCLNTFLGFCQDHVIDYSSKSGNLVFLHRLRTKKELSAEKEAEPDKKIARLAIGVEGGFNPDAGDKKYEYTTTSSIVIFPDRDTIHLPNENLPQLVQEAVQGVERAEGVLHTAEMGLTGDGAWDGEVRHVSKHADSLLQLNNGVKVPPRGWECSQCQVTDNLWLNLTDGTILCGRRQMDGSGGNNHAAEHYEKTKYPLAVKLGTITAEGKADVYSYCEDDMVLDPHLVQHLAHFGINVSLMEKTDKTMAELEIDYNQRVWEYSRLTESGQKLVPIFGPGYTGLLNLGNSCYINSVVQVLMMVPSIVERYASNANNLMAAVNPSMTSKDFDFQFAKLASGLISGKYSVPPPSFDAASPSAEMDVSELQPGISPALFRALVGRGHPEFSTRRQQDAMEYLEHLLKLIERSALKAGVSDPGHCFRFGVEDKFVCSSSGCSRYVQRSDLYLPLPVPLQEATNKQELDDFRGRKARARQLGERFTEDTVRAHVPYACCLSRLVAPETMTAYSSAVKASVPMTRTTRLSTFPDYLFVQLVKFGVTEKWEPVKYDVSVPMPELLDLEVLRAGPRPEGEQLMPDNPDGEASPAQSTVDEGVVQQLCEIGFTTAASRKAVHYTGNVGSEAALNWLMDHSRDPDIDKPFPGSTSNEATSFTPNEEGLMMLESMGFARAQARLALKETQNNLERAADWLFSRQSELEHLVALEEQGASANTAAPVTSPAFTDGNAKYELVGFISHMGTSIHVGHYVSHIKKNGQWTIFNDNKVALSVDPPLDLGYLYLYKRASL